MEEDVEMNPKLLKIIMETLDKVSDDNRMNFVHDLFNDFNDAVNNARSYSMINQTDYKTVLKDEISKKELELTRYCDNYC